MLHLPYLAILNCNEWSRTSPSWGPLLEFLVPPPFWVPNMGALALVWSWAIPPAPIDADTDTDSRACPCLPLPWHSIWLTSAGGGHENLEKSLCCPLAVSTGGYFVRGTPKASTPYGTFLSCSGNSSPHPVHQKECRGLWKWSCGLWNKTLE